MVPNTSLVCKNLNLDLSNCILKNFKKFSQLQDQLHLSQSQLIKKLVEDKHEVLKINPL